MKNEPPVNWLLPYTAMVFAFGMMVVIVCDLADPRPPVSYHWLKLGALGFLAGLMALLCVTGYMALRGALIRGWALESAKHRNGE